MDLTYPRLGGLRVGLVFEGTPEEVANAELLAEFAPAFVAEKEGIEIVGWLFPVEAVTDDVAEVTEGHFASREEEGMIVGGGTGEALGGGNGEEGRGDAIEFFAAGDGVALG